MSNPRFRSPRKIAVVVEYVCIYLGEDGGPDGLNVLDLGGAQESLELVGLL